MLKKKISRVALPKKPAAEKSALSVNSLHPRNRHTGRYDLPSLIACCPELTPFVAPNAYGNESIDFANPDAVRGDGEEEWAGAAVALRRGGAALRKARPRPDRAGPGTLGSGKQVEGGGA